MIIMFLGDTHGSRGFTEDAIEVAADLGVDRIVQVGDFGFWPHIEAGQKFLAHVGKASRKCAVPVYWLAGNHEDWITIKDTMESGVDPVEDPFHHGKNVTYIRSGARWEWGGMTFGCLPGAFSVDRGHRVKYSNRSYGWFPEEMPDGSLIPGLGTVDVLLTHDAPIVPPKLMASGHFRSIPESSVSQDVVYRGIMSATPKYLVHGHWHHREVYGVAGCEVWGLDCDLSVQLATCVLDTETREMYSLIAWSYKRTEEANGTEATTGAEQASDD